MKLVRFCVLVGFFCLTAASAQIPCEYGCSPSCPMDYSYPVYYPGCDCPWYYDCVPVGTCDYCMYDGVGYCSGWWCWTYYGITFNWPTGCCAGSPGT